MEGEWRVCEGVSRWRVSRWRVSGVCEECDRSRWRVCEEGGVVRDKVVDECDVVVVTDKSFATF